MNSLHDLPADMAAAVKTETQGEIVRWVGRPNARRAFLGSIAIWIIGIPWTALTGGIFSSLVAVVLSGKPPPNAWTGMFAFIALIFTGAFVLIGLGMMAMPFLSWAKARRTVHVITDKRVVTLQLGRTREVTTLMGHRIINTKRSERRDGTGTLRIVTGREKDSDGDWHESAHVLSAVANVGDASRLVAELMPAR